MKCKVHIILDNKGSTLLEALIALSLLVSVGVLAFSILTKTLNGNTPAKRISALALAQREMEYSLYYQDFTNNIERDSKWRIVKIVMNRGEKRIITVSVYYGNSITPCTTLHSVGLSVRNRE
ncbi:MAG: hypothetical protein WCY96_02145 [Candidatus Cloacimonadaceae bacterium]